jgi:hypothetical protein
VFVSIGYLQLKKLVTCFAKIIVVFSGAICQNDFFHEGSIWIPIHKVGRGVCEACLTRREEHQNDEPNEAKRLCHDVAQHRRECYFGDT